MKNGKSESNDDQISIQRENRKFIGQFLQSLQEMKGNSYNGIKQFILNTFQTCRRDITQLVDAENNSLAHWFTKEEKVNFLQATLDAYATLLNANDDFYQWLLLENDQTMTAFDIAAQQTNKELLTCLYEAIKTKHDIQLKLFHKRNNPIHYAAKKNLCYPILFFMDKMHNEFQNQERPVIDLSNQYDITPLHYACYYSNRKVMDLLIDFGANVNQKDQSGNTCLHYAVNSGSASTVKKLIIRGADKTLKDIKNQTPYDIAKKMENNEEIRSLLQSKSRLAKIICCATEMTAAKRTRYHLIIIFGTILAVLFKVYWIIIYHVNQGRIVNISENNKDSPPIALMWLCLVGLALDILELCLLLIFFCKAKFVRREGNSLSSLLARYQESERICVKCRETMEPHTIHCIVCDSCVKNWDHHCFWLNKCINAHNKSYFNAFIVTLFLMIQVNITCGCWVLVLSYQKNGISILSCIFAFLLILTLYCNFFMLIPFMISQCKYFKRRESVISEREFYLLAKSLKDDHTRYSM